MDEIKDEDYRWVRGGSKSIALLWLRQKNQDLMEIANACVVQILLTNIQPSIQETQTIQILIFKEQFSTFLPAGA